MSYDLYFTQPKISRQEFDTYFQGRPNYRLNGSQAFYENEATGAISASNTTRKTARRKIQRPRLTR